MHSFHFTRKAVISDEHARDQEIDGGERTLHVSVNHNGDWSGTVIITVVSAPAGFTDAEASSWFMKLAPKATARVRSESTVDAATLLNGDVDPGSQPWLVARVLGATIAQAVVRRTHNAIRSAVDDLWFPHVHTEFGPR